jgi:hypothetical protein
MVPAVRAIVHFLEPVEPFQPDTQVLAQLPDDVSARVVRKMIERIGLPPVLSRCA